MQPDILLLDEPTSQLDPIAASDFISTVKKLNTELSLTVIIIEHRLEEIIPVSDRVITLENGRIICDSPAREAVTLLSSHPILKKALPAAVRLFSGLKLSNYPCPLTIREGRNLVESYASNAIRKKDYPHYVHSSETALEFEDVRFRYERNLPDVLNDLSFTVYKGEIFCLLGGNGSGKSTAVSVAAALLKPYAGTVKVFGKKLREYKNQSLYRSCLSVLPQDVQTVFLKNTVREELKGLSLETLPFDLSSLMDMHPYDLSGGQQQLVALAKVLSTAPRLLLLDEPTKGLDAQAKEDFAGILKQLKKNGVTIVCVTHDAEFASKLADRCALIFRGDAVSVSDTRSFFSGNTFYTTAAGRMSRNYYDDILDTEELTELCLINRRKSI